jgi:serine/threonine-protein kinase
MSSEIASGGMATVHLGRLMASAGFARTVVIKRMLAELVDNREFVAMFIDEACLAARVRHPHVVSTLDVIREGKELLIVMEYVHGASFEALLRTASQQGRRVPLPIAATLVGHGLLGLHAAHEATSETGEPLGIVHRDFSPHNLLVDTHGVARVADFGVAKARQKLHKTKEGQVKGKWSYMSPEQVAGEDVDRRSDVFAAGIVLWEALTLRRLFEDPHPAKVATAIAFQETEPPSKHVADVPPELDAVVLKALQKDPGDRYPTAAAMARALHEVCPVADGLTVGGWVTELVPDLLQERREMVAQLERATANTPKLPSSAAVSLLESSNPLREVIEAASNRAEPALTRLDTPGLAKSEKPLQAVAPTSVGGVAPTGVQQAVAAASETRVSATGMDPIPEEAIATLQREDGSAPITAAPMAMKQPSFPVADSSPAPPSEPAPATEPPSRAPPSSGELATVPDVLEGVQGTLPPTLEASQLRKPRRWPWLAAGVVLLGGVGAGVWWQLVWNQPSPATSGRAKKKKQPKEKPKQKVKTAAVKPSASPLETSEPAPTTPSAPPPPSAEPAHAPPTPFPHPRAPNCAKPYYVRADGVRVYRRECFEK